MNCSENTGRCAQRKTRPHATIILMSTTRAFLLLLPALSALAQNPRTMFPAVRGTREMVLAPNHVLVYRILKRTDIIEIVRIVGARQNYGRQARR